MAKKRKPKTKPSSTTNAFNALEEPPSDILSGSNKCDDTDSDTESVKILKPCGTKNSDGTFYGGGPLDIHCSKCTKAGYPKPYCHGHRSNQRNYCPLLQLAQTSPQESARQQLSPDLKHLADQWGWYEKGTRW